jgi:hypothetical protein
VKLFLLATMSVLILLTACQSRSENDPPPVIKPYECPQHTLETGMCGT